MRIGVITSWPWLLFGPQRSIFDHFRQIGARSASQTLYLIILNAYRLCLPDLCGEIVWIRYVVSEDWRPRVNDVLESIGTLWSKIPPKRSLQVAGHNNGFFGAWAAVILVLESSKNNLSIISNSSRYTHIRPDLSIRISLGEYVRAFANLQWVDHTVYHLSLDTPTTYL